MTQTRKRSHEYIDCWRCTGRFCNIYIKNKVGCKIFVCINVLIHTQRDEHIYSIASKQLIEWQRKKTAEEKKKTR